MSFSFLSHGKTGVWISGHNDTKNGMPAGGHAHDQDPGQPPRFAIKWQDGPHDRESGEPPNGAFVEDVLEVCKKRLEFYQNSGFECVENNNALNHIERAINELNRRRDDREARGVLGKNEV